MKPSTLSLAWMLMVACSTASAQAALEQPEAAEPAQSAEDLAREIEASAPGSDCGENLARLIELTSRTDFEVFLHPRRQAMLLMRIVMCMGDAGRFDSALEYANRAAAVDPGSFGVQGARLTLGFLAGRPQDSIDALDALSRLRPEYVRTIDGYRIEQLIDAAMQADPAGDGALRIHESLALAGWQPDAFMPDGSFRVAHAILLVERGRLAEARRQLASVTDLESLVLIHVDRRLEALRQDPEFMAQFDLSAGIERSVARARSAMEDNPRSLLAVYRHAAVLIEANRGGDALQVLDASLQRLRDDATAFDDAEAASAVRNLVAALHYEQGAYDEGRALFESLVQETAGHPFESSVRMTFARFLVGEGRAQQALDVLPAAGSMTRFGEAEAESYRICARAQLGDAPGPESLGQLAASAPENAEAQVRALLCLDDRERLAALTIDRLRNAGSRRETLLSLQVCPATAFGELPYMQTLGGRIEALRARADVQAALRDVGRIESVPVMLPRLY